jgi:hypothetical protein
MTRQCMREFLLKSHRMSRRISDQELRAILELSAPKRYDHFVKQIVDGEEVWGLRNESGWLLLGDIEGQELFPVWPHERYATEYARAQCTTEAPASIALSDWSEQWLPRFLENGVVVAVFPLPNGQGIPVAPQTLQTDIAAELRRYE